MEDEGRTVVVPEEIFSVAPDLAFGSLGVIRKPRGRSLSWVAREARGVIGAITLLTDRVTASIMDALPGLKIIANCAVGVDNIDIPGATERGIWVTHTPGVLTEATADLTWALILSVARRMSEGERAIHRREFRGWGFDFLLGLELKGRTLGIIGPGRIGTAVARRGRAFGMDVCYHGRRRSPAFEAETGGRYFPLDDLLSLADVVSIHVPLDPGTEGMIGEKELGLMKRNAILVNTSRGGVIDERALVHALECGRLFGAGLDVFEKEPSVPERLLHFPNVVLTPHIGSATWETRRSMARLACQNLMAVIHDRSPLHPVNRPERKI